MDMSRPTLSSSPSDGNETAAAPISYDPQDSFKGDVYERIATGRKLLEQFRRKTAVMRVVAAFLAVLIVLSFGFLLIYRSQMRFLVH